MSKTYLDLLSDLIFYTLEVLSLLGYNTSFLAVYKDYIKNCENYTDRNFAAKYSQQVMYLDHEVT